MPSETTILDQVIESCDDPVILRNLLRDTRSTLRDVTRELAASEADRKMARKHAANQRKATAAGDAGFRSQRDDLLRNLRLVLDTQYHDRADEVIDLERVVEAAEAEAQ